MRARRCSLGLAHALIFCKAGALLQSSGLLQQPLLRVQAHRSALAWPSSNAGWAESALAAHDGVETEGLLNAASPLAIWPSSDRRQLVSDLPGGTAAGHGFQVDGEGFLGEAVPIGLKRDPGDQPATRLLELLLGSPVAISTVPEGLLHLQAGVGLALRHQFQRPIAVIGIPRQDLQSGDQLALGLSRQGQLMAFETLGLALVAIAHFRVMHRDDAILGHPVLQLWATLVVALDILAQQLSQKLRSSQDVLLLLAARTHLLELLACPLQQAVRIGDDPLQENLPGRFVIPVDLRLTLDARAEVAAHAMRFGPGLRLDPFHSPGQRPDQLLDPVRQQVACPGPAGQGKYPSPHPDPE